MAEATLTPAKEIEPGQVVKLMAPDGEPFSFEVIEATPIERGKYIAFTMHPVGFAEQYRETREISADRKLQVVG